MSNLPIDPNTEHRSHVHRGDRCEVRKIRLTPLTADPADAVDGEIWYRSDLNQLRTRLNGSNLSITAA